MSSGYKINRAGDDAAGLAISEKMRGQISGLNMATKNAQDGISLIQTAEGALNEVHAILQRGCELAVQAANDTNTDEDREKLNAEVQSVFDEIENIGKTTEFNAQRLFSDNVTPNISLNIHVTNITDVNNSADNISASSLSADEKTLAQRLHDIILPNAVKAVQDAYGLSPKNGNKFELDVEFVREGKGNSVAYVTSAVYTNGDSFPFKLSVDLDDVLAPGGTWIDADRIIAHEMTHAVMSASGIKWDNSTPDWFIEGAAEYVGGANERVKSSILNAARMSETSFNSASQTVKDSAMKSILNAIDGSGSDFYSAGFLATAYLDKLITQKDSTKSIKDFMAAISSGGQTFDQAIQSFTNFSSEAAFKAAFKGANGLAFLQARDPINTTEIGSVLTDKRVSGYGLTDGTFLSDTTAVSSTVSDAWFTYDWQPSTGGTGTAGVTAPNGLGVGGAPPVARVNPGDGFVFHIGANENQTLKIEKLAISKSALSINGVDVSTQETSELSISAIDEAIEKVSEGRSKYGAYQNRLEHTMTNLQNTSENLTAAESRIRDTDMAKEMIAFTKNNILTQAAQSMLAQANQQPQGVLSLLS